ncbi:hypothetical protein LLH23_13825 [bacterium]|nr:hypothetical protein [bacterium]
MIYGVQRCNLGRVHEAGGTTCVVGIAQYKSAVDAALFFDAVSYKTCADIYYATPGVAGCTSTCTGPAAPKFCHNDGCNLSFVDGHVKYYSQGALMGNISTFRRQL